MRRRLIPAVVLVTVLAAGLAFQRLQTGPTLRETTDTTVYGKQHTPARTATATFAAGCFWKLEDAMRQVDGVVATESGYTGGHGADVTHATLSAGATGHAEAVRVTFDPQRVLYDRLLDVFWSSHDPTRFTVDEGEPPPPGRSIVFYHTEAQRLAAEASKRRLEAGGKYQQPIPTEINPATTFHRAEPEHQQYLEKHGRGACRIATR